MENILNELITEIMSLGEDTKKPLPKGMPAGLTAGSFGKYYFDVEKKKYAGKIASGEWIPATSEPDKKLAAPPTKQEPTIPQTQKSKDITDKSKKVQKVFGKPNTDNPVSDETLDKVVNLLEKITIKTPGVLGNLLDAIKNGDEKRMRYEVESLGLTISSTDRLVSTVHGDIFGKGDTGRNALKLIGSVLIKFGIELERKKGKLEDVKPKISKEEFKPTQIIDTEEFPQAETTLITYQDGTDVRGFAVDKSEYKIIRRNKQRLIETDNLNEILVGQGMSQSEAEQRAEEYDQLMASHNQQVKYLASKMGGEKPVKFKRLPAGKQGRELLKNTLLKTMLENSDVSDIQKNTITDTLTKLSSAETTEEFDAGWKTFRTQLENDVTLRPAIPYICESVEMLRKSVNNQIILIPLTDTFKTADVVALAQPLEQVDVDNIDSVFENIKLVQVQVDLRSVKSLEGGASVMGEKTELTLFNSEQRKTDLMRLSSSQSHAALWKSDTKEKFDAYTAEQLKVLEQYLPDILEYYKLPSNTAFDEMVGVLSGGSLPRYDKQGNYIGAGKPSTTFNKEMTDLNRLQLRMYSLIGFASDAIYNRGAILQGFTNTTFYDNGIVETDGRYVMGRSAFQFNKNISKRSNGTIRDDGFQSKIVPSSKDEMGIYK